jgi:hypothetical protein
LEGSVLVGPLPLPVGKTAFQLVSGPSSTAFFVLFVVHVSSGQPLLGSVAILKKKWWEVNELIKVPQNRDVFT